VCVSVLEESVWMEVKGGSSVLLLYSCWHVNLLLACNVYSISGILKLYIFKYVYNSTGTSLIKKCFMLLVIRSRKVGS